MVEADDISGLIARDDRFATLLERLPPLTHRNRPGGFGGLLQLIVEQQLSTVAAATIWGRLEAGLISVTPQNLLDHAEDDLRAYGLSRPKIAYAKGLAQTVASGDLDFNALLTLETEAAVGALTAVKGIGRWSAEVYLMFCEGRTDLFPVGDVALREALGWFEGLDVRPNEAQSMQYAAKWSPYRSTASLALWSFYGAVKRGELPRVFV